MGGRGASSPVAINGRIPKRLLNKTYELPDGMPFKVVEGNPFTGTDPISMINKIYATAHLSNYGVVYVHPESNNVLDVEAYGQYAHQMFTKELKRSKV